MKILHQENFELGAYTLQVIFIYLESKIIPLMFITRENEAIYNE